MGSHLGDVCLTLGLYFIFFGNRVMFYTVRKKL
jgi:hypothetical protein